jgi:hypothetical protein
MNLVDANQDNAARLPVRQAHSTQDSAERHVASYLVRNIGAVSLWLELASYGLLS